MLVLLAHDKHRLIEFRAFLFPLVAMLTSITLYLLWGDLILHNKLPQISRCVSAFYLPTTALYLRPLTMLLALAIEHLLIETAVVTATSIFNMFTLLVPITVS